MECECQTEKLAGLFCLRFLKIISKKGVMCRHRSCEDPELELNGQKIEFVKEKKFLGLIWDTKLNFNAHIQYLKQKCQNSLNIIKILSHTDWGSGKKILLRLYRALVRSKLDYGCIIYRNASEKSLKCLDVIHNQGIRLSLGAFKSSPVESLYVEANELPLSERRIEHEIWFTH